MESAWNAVGTFMLVSLAVAAGILVATAVLSALAGDEENEDEPK